MPWLPSLLLPMLPAAWIRPLCGAAHPRRWYGLRCLCGPHAAQGLQGEQCFYSDRSLPHHSCKAFPMVLKSSLRARISAKPTKSWRAWTDAKKIDGKNLHFQVPEKTMRH